jgi:hypothetical protein
MVLYDFPRFSLRFPDLAPLTDTLRGDCLSRHYTQRKTKWMKKVDSDRIKEELNTVQLMHLIENTMTYQQPPNPNYPPQYPPQQTAPQLPSQAEMWAELQRLRSQQTADQQKIAEQEKKERQSTYRVRRAKGSGNLSFNWGDSYRGAYLTPSKYQDGRVTVAGASIPAQITLQNTPQGPHIVCTIIDGPLNAEEVELFNEWFVKPIEVIPTRKGPRTATTPPPVQPPQQFAPQPQFTPPPVAPQQYTPAPTPQQYQAPVQQYPPQQTLPQPNAMASIAHLPPDLQKMIVAEATTLQQSAPQAYPSLDLAVQAVKRAKNIT